VISTFDKAIMLKNVDIFNSINTEELLRIAEISQDVCFKSGQTVFSEGDQGDSLYFLTEGRVELRSNGQAQASVLKNGSIGIYALLTSSPRYFTAVALTDTCALRISSHEFMDLLSENDRICKSLIRALALKVVEKNL